MTISFFFLGFHVFLYSMGLYEYVNSRRPLSLSLSLSLYVVSNLVLFSTVSPVCSAWDIYIFFWSSVLDAFAKLRRATISVIVVICLSVCPSVLLSVRPSVRLSVCPSVCPSVRPSVRLSVSPHGTAGTAHEDPSIFLIISRSVLLVIRIRQTKVVQTIKTHILCSVTFFLNRVFCEMIWTNTVERGRPQMAIWRMRIACRAQKVTNTHSEYVILIVFPQQQRFDEHASMLHYTYSTLEVRHPRSVVE